MANGNPWFSAVEQTLPQYVPLPFQELAAAGQAVQSRYDTAMAGLDATATGLATLEARLPAHQRYVSEYADRFRTEADELLSRYNYNAADPQFGRELTRLRSRFANDPNLRTIQSANLLYDANAKTRQKLMETGQRYIDTTRGATGIDPTTGRLTADTGIIRATKYDEDLRTMFRDTIQATINDGRGRVTNEAAIANTVENLMSGGANNPVLREGMEYYMSQGMNPEQAQQQLQLDIQREAASALKIDKDWGADTSARGWANIDLQRRKFNFEQAKHFEQAGSVASLISVNPSSIQTIADMKTVANRELKMIKDSIDPVTGVINAEPKTEYEDTPENRAVLGRTGGFEESVGSAPTGFGGFGVYPGQTSTQLARTLKPKTTEQAKTIRNEEIANKIEYMRSELGLGTDVSPTEVVNRYENFANKNAFVPKSIKFTVSGASKAIADAHGVDLSDAVLLDGKNYKRINPDDFDLSNAKDDAKLIEFITTEVPGLEGAGAVAKYTRTIDGKQRTYFKPIPQEFAQRMPVTLTGARAQSSGLSNNELLDPQNGFVQQVPETGVVFAPQLGGTGVRFVQLNPQTLEPIKNANGSYKFIPDQQMREREAAEQREVSSYGTQSYRSTVKQE